jgi:hypothetical protein
MAQWAIPQALGAADKPCLPHGKAPFLLFAGPIIRPQAESHLLNLGIGYFKTGIIGSDASQGTQLKLFFDASGPFADVVVERPAVDHPAEKNRRFFDGPLSGLVVVQRRFHGPRTDHPFGDLVYKKAVHRFKIKPYFTPKYVLSSRAGSEKSEENQDRPVKKIRHIGILKKPLIGIIGVKRGNLPKTSLVRDSRNGYV